MKKKFINAAIYKHDGASEILVENGKFAAIGNDLGAADETIDLQGRFVLTAKLVAMFREADNTRLFFILGAGSLKNGKTNELAIEDIRMIPGSEAWVSIPENQLKQLEFLKSVDNVNWVGVSPSMIFQEGDNKDFVLGEDELLVDEDGNSITSSGTLAAAILDEIENPTVHQARFTVRDNG